ncbi:MAG: hypothetical protein ABI395_04025 [Sphingobium sp.]
MARTGHIIDEPFGLSELISHYLIEPERQTLLHAITNLLRRNDAVLLHMQVPFGIEQSTGQGDAGMIITLYDPCFRPYTLSHECRAGVGDEEQDADIVARLGSRVMEAVAGAWPPYTQPVPPSAISDGTGIAICAEKPGLDALHLIAELAAAHFRLVDVLPLAAEGTLRRMIAPQTTTPSQN